MINITPYDKCFSVSLSNMKQKLDRLCFLLLKSIIETLIGLAYLSSILSDFDIRKIDDDVEASSSVLTQIIAKIKTNNT